MDNYDDLFAAHVDGPIFTDPQTLEIRPVKWLDKPFLPWGELVVLAGDGGVGKGLFSVHQASRVSRAGGTVVFVAAEDSFDTVLKPRLLAAGADLQHIRFLSWQRRGSEDALKIPEDIPALERALTQMRACMLIVDPLMSHLAGGMDTHRDHEVKRALLPLAGLAQRTGALVLGNHHLGKDKRYGTRNAVMGSVAFVTSPRVALAMTAHEETVRSVEILKSNLGGQGLHRSYEITTTHVDGLEDFQPLMVTAQLGQPREASVWDGTQPSNVIPFRRAK